VAKRKYHLTLTFFVSHVTTLTRFAWEHMERLKFPLKNEEDGWGINPVGKIRSGPGRGGAGLPCVPIYSAGQYHDSEQSEFRSGAPLRLMNS
jgi:hypothetical protein